MIADLHCDLLAYLQESPQHTAHDKIARCSIPQLTEGGVAVQTMAIFTETKAGSQLNGMQQYQHYLQLPSKYPNHFRLFDGNPTTDKKIQTLLAIENGSGICGEEESLQQGLDRLNAIQTDTNSLLYISLTWNFENRFGGGALTDVGLKPDGKVLLDHLDNKGVAIDMSHTSDRLAYDILNYIDQKQLQIFPIASHSNFRAVTDVPRNLPDSIAKEIIDRGGIIGLCFVHDFIGANSPNNLIKHVEHGLNLGAERQLCFGADYFYEGSIPASSQHPDKKWFFPTYDTSASYPRWISMIRDDLQLSPKVIKRLSYNNFMNFLGISCEPSSCGCSCK